MYVSARSGRTDKGYNTKNTYSHFYDRQVVSGGAEITEVFRRAGINCKSATIPGKVKRNQVKNSCVRTTKSNDASVTLK